MSNPKIRIHNIETNEIIDREMTDAEFAQYELDKANDQVRVNAIIANKNAKSALLEKLDITEDEAKLLLA